MEKLYKKDICKVPSLEIKANLGCQREKKKKKLGSSFLRQISQPSFQISQAALPQASVVAAGRLSVAADPVAWAPVLVIHCAPWGLSSDTHSNKAVLRNSHEKSEAGLKFLQKFLLKNCFLWKLPIYFLLSFFILIPQFEFLSDICDHPTPELS